MEEHKSEQELRLEKIEKYEKEGPLPYAYSFSLTHRAEEILRDYENLEN